MNKVNKKHIHIIGICGVATSAIAIAFKNKGWKVTGSDKGFYPPVSTELEKNGIEFYAGWHPEKIGEPGLVVMGASGTSKSNPEIIYIKNKSIPLLSFAEAVGKYIVKKNSIVTVGTWGKTTNSALLSYILIQAGFDPSYLTGGISLSHKAGVVADSKWSVVEGDEYQTSISDKKPKFSYYKPTHLLLTAISWDHADLYPTEESYLKVFEDLISKSKFIVANKDNAKVRELVKKAVWYGKADADYVYSNVEQTKNGLNFKINNIKITSPMIGSFQAENITGCFAMASELGIEKDKIVEAIGNFKGLKRRLEKRYEDKKVTVFDDIAHSPEKASSVLKNIREIYKGKITAIFEPNIGARSYESVSKYDNAFKEADLVIIPKLTKLKTSEERRLDGEDLVKIISKTHKNALYIPEDADLIKKAITSSDSIVFLGSHGFRGMIEETITSLRRQSR